MSRDRRWPCLVLAGSLLLSLLPSTVAAATTGGSSVGIGDAVVTEPTGKTGLVAVQLPLTISPASVAPVTVSWQTVAGSATAADFVAATGTATIAAGAAGASIAVQVRADRLTEPVESFSVQLTGASGASLVRSTGQVTIRQASTQGLYVGDVTAIAPDAGVLQAGVPVTLSATYKKPVTFGWQLRSGTGTVGVDVVAASGTATIAAGSLGTTISVGVIGRVLAQPDVSVSLEVTSATTAPVADGSGSITIHTDAVDPFGWTPPPGSIPSSGTVLYVQSTPGDFVGQGRTYTYTKANSLLTVTATAGRVDFSVQGDKDWSGSVAEPSANGSVQTGFWAGVGRYPFFVPGVTFTGDGRGCNTVVGSFIVDQVAYQGGVLRATTLRFVQQCDGGAPLYGFLRFDASDPTLPPPPGDPALFAWSPPAGAVPANGSYLYFQSTAGDWIGQGSTQLYTSADSSLTASSSANTVTMSVSRGSDWWYLNVAGQYTQSQLQTGLYSNVERYPFNNPATGGLSFYGDGRGCNTLLGSFAIDRIAYDPAGLLSIAGRFVQQCEVTGPPLYGAFRWVRGG